MIAGYDMFFATSLIYDFVRIIQSDAGWVGKNPARGVFDKPMRCECYNRLYIYTWSLLITTTVGPEPTLPQYSQFCGVNLQVKLQPNNLTSRARHRPDPTRYWDHLPSELQETCGGGAEGRRQIIQTDYQIYICRWVLKIWLVWKQSSNLLILGVTIWWCLTSSAQSTTRPESLSSISRQGNRGSLFTRPDYYQRRKRRKVASMHDMYGSFRTSSTKTG